MSCPLRMVLSSCTGTATTTAELAFVIVIGIAGFFGNGVVLLVLLYDKTSRVKQRNFLVINQSLVDVLSCIAFVVTYSSKSISKSYEGAGIWWCWLIDVEIPMWTFIAISTTNLMAITVERYLMVVFPVIHHTHITKPFIYGTVALVWAFTAFLIFGFAYPFSGVSGGACHLQAFFPHKALALFVSVYYNVAYFIVPITMFMVCYPHMMSVMKKRMKIVPGNTTINKRAKVTKRQMNLTQVMLSVSVAFIVCWAPLNVHYLLMFSGAFPQLKMHDLLYRCLVYLSLINSCVNPVLYAYNYDDFKKGFSQLFLKRFPDHGNESNKTDST